VEFWLRDCEEIYNAIYFYNDGSRGDKRIPESDSFLRELANTLALDEQKVEQYLEALRDSNNIFIFDIAKADEERDMAALAGYVVASYELVEELYSLHDERLHKFYTKEYNRDKSTDAIVKEILPQMRTLNNTALGNLVNIVSMLREFLYYLQNHPQDYEADVRSQLLKKQLQEKKLWQEQVSEEEKKGEGNEGRLAQGEAEQSDVDLRRELDSGFSEIPISSNSDLYGMRLDFEKAIKIYGLYFIIRHHFKKYQFRLVEEYVQQNKYFDLTELKQIRDLLKDYIKKINSDTRLALYKSDIFRLDRTLAKAIRKYSISI
jgi:hypothetical protein